MVEFDHVTRGYPFDISGRMKQLVPILGNGLNLKNFSSCKPPVVVKDG
jgi:hypothetical protein